MIVDLVKRNLIERLAIHPKTWAPIVLVDGTWYTIDKFVEAFCDKTSN